MNAATLLVGNTPRTALEGMIAAHYVLHAIRPMLDTPLPQRDERAYLSALDSVTPYIRRLFREHGGAVPLPPEATDPSSAPQFWAAIACALLSIAKTACMIAPGSQSASFYAGCFEIGCLISKFDAHPEGFPSITPADLEGMDYDA
jgi:hypothetical protein